jgi:MYXO-CTERM domain-containing protein
MAFTPSDTYLLTQIDVAMWRFAGSVDLGLHSDIGGMPGTLLEDWTITTFGSLFTCCTVSTVTPSTSITLDAGTQYWLVASSVSNSGAAWAVNNTGQRGTMEQGGVRRTDAEGAFDVLGTSAVPEPASASFVVFGVTLLGLAARRRRRA